MIFPNILFCVYEVSLHIFCHQFIHRDFANLCRLLDYFLCVCWVLETGPKNAHSLNKSSVYFEASTDSHHHWTENVCITSPWYLLLLLCLMASIILATVFLENLSKSYVSLSRKSESQKISCLLSHLHSKRAQNAWVNQDHSYCRSPEEWSVGSRGKFLC